MHVETLRRPPAEVAAEWTAVGVFSDANDAPASLQGTPLGDTIARLLQARELGDGVGDVTPLHGLDGAGPGSTLVFGLGSRAAFGPGPAYAAGVAVARKLAIRRRGHVAVVLPDAGDPAITASALTEGLVVGTQGPGLHKTEPARHPFGTLSVVVPPSHTGAADVEAAVRRGEVVGRAVNLARELANLPPRDKPPTRLAARAREVAIEAGLGVEVWDAARVTQERFGGLLGVSSGSDEAPAFVVLDYRGRPGGPTLALVGKGITFDSGGLSLKPSASMEDMKADMTGAAVVLATLAAAARLGIEVNVRGYLALAENMTGGKAMKLGDVLTMRNGTTVEILNTDAEGRLILADALSYAVESSPEAVIDLATLTGACVVALGQKVAGLFSNDDELAARLDASARQAGERLWRMPLDDDYRDGLKSQVADLKNVGGKWGGAVTAAKFLQHFVGTTRWAHLDIAGPSWADSDGPTRDAGGTGCYVRTLVRLLEGGWD